MKKSRNPYTLYKDTYTPEQWDIIRNKIVPLMAVYGFSFDGEVFVHSVAEQNLICKGIQPYIFRSYYNHGPRIPILVKRYWSPILLQEVTSLLGPVLKFYDLNLEEIIDQIRGLTKNGILTYERLLTIYDEWVQKYGNPYKLTKHNFLKILKQVVDPPRLFM